MNELILRETPPDTDDHAHRPHLEGARIAPPIMYLAPAATVHKPKRLLGHLQTTVHRLQPQMPQLSFDADAKYKYLELKLGLRDCC